eukprot:5841210-Prymnesium_polylepis.1
MVCPRSVTSAPRAHPTSKKPRCPPCFSLCVCRSPTKEHSTPGEKRSTEKPEGLHRPRCSPSSLISPPTDGMSESPRRLLLRVSPSATLRNPSKDCHAPALVILPG